MAKQTQKGFAAVEAVLIVVVLVLMGGVGYWVVSKNKPKVQTASQATVDTQKTVAPIATPTAVVEQTLTQAVDTEDSVEESGAADVENKVGSAADAASNVGDSFNENNL